MLIVYSTAINKTIKLYRENERLKETKITAEGAENDLDKLKNRLNSLNKYYGLYNTNSLENPQFVLESISNLCKKHNIVLKKFPKPKLIVENDFVIETNIVETQGTFNSLLFLLNDLERINNIGRISSVTFKSYKDNKSKKLVLSLVIYLQCIKFNNGDANA